MGRRSGGEVSGNDPRHGFDAGSASASLFPQRPGYAASGRPGPGMRESIAQPRRHGVDFVEHDFPESIRPDDFDLAAP